MATRGMGCGGAGGFGPAVSGLRWGRDGDARGKGGRALRPRDQMVESIPFQKLRCGKGRAGAESKWVESG